MSSTYSSGGIPIEGAVALVTGGNRGFGRALVDELETNLFGIIRVARAFAPVLAEQPQSSMVNVLSALSWLSFGRGYEISKAAAWSATNALRLALRDQGTIVTALHVGYMDT